MAEPRTVFEDGMEKLEALKCTEASGQVADSMDVCIALMALVRNREITLEQTQAELKKIKSKAKSQGLITRAQAFSRE